MRVVIDDRQLRVGESGMHAEIGCDRQQDDRDERNTRFELVQQLPVPRRYFRLRVCRTIRAAVHLGGMDLKRFSGQLPVEVIECNSLDIDPRLYMTAFALQCDDLIAVADLELGFDIGLASGQGRFLLANFGRGTDKATVDAKALQVPGSSIFVIRRCRRNPAVLDPAVWCLKVHDAPLALGERHMPTPALFGELRAVELEVPGDQCAGDVNVRVDPAGRQAVPSTGVGNNFGQGRIKGFGPIERYRDFNRDAVR